MLAQPQSRWTAFIERWDGRLERFRQSIDPYSDGPERRIKPWTVAALSVGLVVLAMISALQAVGVVLALGLLVAPAATVYLFSDRYEWLFWGGGIVGMFGACFGLLLSYWLNLPSGPCITLLLGLIFAGAYLFSPRYGLLPRLLRRKRHFHEESLERWQGHPPA